MSSTGSGNVTSEEFEILVRRAGLNLSPEEMEHLWPMYQQLAEQIGMLHDPSLPLEEPAVTFPAAWFPR
jgi:hypothetical protein